jgi:hypothetical protein
MEPTGLSSHMVPPVVFGVDGSGRGAFLLEDMGRWLRPRGPGLWREGRQSQAGRLSWLNQIRRWRPCVM